MCLCINIPKGDQTLIRKEKKKKHELIKNLAKETKNIFIIT